MSELLLDIERYWTDRTEGYSKVNEKEMEGIQRKAWLEVLQTYFPKKDPKDLKILDIGTGPGFFPMILLEAGYSVTAIDYTQNMLKKAEENIQKFIPMAKDQWTLLRMDAQNLEFEDESFDVVISRNLTWNLEKPERAYKEWCRVLRSQGILLNFDANWYGYLYDTHKRELYEKDRKNVEQAQMEDHYNGTDIDAMERIAEQVPLSSKGRPMWDVEVLTELSMKVHVDEALWKKVWSEEEKINYASTPMFMIYARKE